MAYNFTATSSQRLTSDSSPVTGAPLTMACWFNAKDTTGNYALLSLNRRTGSSDNRWNLIASGGMTGDPLRYFVNSTVAFPGNGANTTSGYSANTWTHACAVSASSSSHTAYLNGGSSATITTDVSPTLVDTLAIGARYSSSWGAYASALIAEVGIWSVALTADEIRSLAAGVSPSLVRPQSLAFYAPLVRDLVDARGGLALTNTSATPVAVHPRIYL